MRTALGIFVAMVLVGAGVAVSADANRWSALLLHGEPLLMIAAAYATVLARGWRRFAIALGALLAFSAQRVPSRGFSSASELPDWAARVRECAEEAGAPMGPVRVMQWTLDPGVDLEVVLARVVEQSPEIAVLQRLSEEAVAAALVAELGGEYLYRDGTAIYTRGAFNRCGDEDRWADGIRSRYAETLVFAGAASGTIFPLLVTSFPGPLDAGDWAGEMSAATSRVAGLAQGAMARTTIVVADASAPRSYRHLDGAFARAGLFAAPAPPNWPTRLGSLPLLSLHPYDRLWAGEGWEVALSLRLPAWTGSRAPVLTVLRSAGQTATSAP